MRRSAALFCFAAPVIAVALLSSAGSALAGGGCHGEVDRDARPSEMSVTTVKLDRCTFAPTIARVPIGAEVRFVNGSQTSHDVIGRDGAWGSGGLLDVGDSFSHRFVDAGVYPFSCSLHPGMAGAVVVGSVSAATPVDDADAADAAAVTDVGAPDDPAVVPIVAAGGLGLVVGAFASAVIVSRRTEREL
jgi:plastocyanin